MEKSAQQVQVERIRNFMRGRLGARQVYNDKLVGGRRSIKAAGCGFKTAAAAQRAADRMHERFGVETAVVKTYHPIYGLTRLAVRAYVPA